MKKDWNTQYIKLDQLLTISRGDKGKLLKYLKQFGELVPVRMEVAAQMIANKNRKGALKVLHLMVPQLTFFGLNQAVDSIRELELNHEDMSWQEWQKEIQKIDTQLKEAQVESQQIIQSMTS